MVVEGKVWRERPTGRARVWQRRRPAHARRQRGGLLDKWADELGDARSLPLLSCHHHLLGMFNALGSYFSERRRGLSKAAGYVGGAYFIGRYVSARLEDVRNTILQERAARDK